MNIIVTGLEAQQVFCFNCRLEDFAALPKRTSAPTGEEIMKALTERSQTGIMTFLQFAFRNFDVPPQEEDFIVLNFAKDGIGVWPFSAKLQHRRAEKEVVH